MRSEPRVSVIIPTYNCARFLPESVNSVLSQTLDDYEIIVVNDGSTDNTEEVLAPFRSRVIYINQINKGLPAALNIGLKAAKGELLTVLDADDLWEKDKLAEQVALFETIPDLGVCFTNFVLFGAEANYRTGFDERNGALIQYARKPIGMNTYLIRSQTLLCDMLSNQAFPKPSTVMFRRCCLEKVGFFDETLTFCQDTHMWLRIAKYYPFAYVDRCLVRRRIRGDSLATSQSDRRYTAEHIHMLETLEKWIPLSDNESKIANKLLSSYCFAVGYQDFSDGLRHASRLHLQKSLRTHFNLKTLAYLVMTFLPMELIKTLRVVKRQIAE